MKIIVVAILFSLSSSFVFSMQLQQPAWQEPAGASYELVNTLHYPRVRLTTFEVTRFPDRVRISITKKENPNGLIFNGWIDGHGAPIIQLPAAEAKRIYNKINPA